MKLYDALFKENFESILFSMSPKLLGVDLRKAQITPIGSNLIKTHVREPDFLKKVRVEDGSEFILHFEFQTTDDLDMIYRMTEYKALLLRTYKMPVKQLVLYVGKKAAKMVSSLPEDQQIKGFTLLDINTWSVDEILESNVPEEIILAILADYNSSDTLAVIRRILERLQQLRLKPAELKKYLQHLTTLSRLRKLEIQTKKEIKTMPIDYDITTDGLYLEGLEKGLEQSKKKHIQGLLRMKKFELEDIAEALDVSIEYVKQIQREMES